MKANDQYGEFRSRGEVRLVRTLPGPIERIWEYLTDSEKRSRWLAAGVMEPRKGGKANLQFRHKEIAPDEVPPSDFKECHDPGIEFEGVITRWEPPRVLAYTFGGPDSEVTFELTPQGRDVLLVLTHRAQPSDYSSIPGYASGWHTHLAQLMAQLEGAPRPPFWPMHTRLKQDYARMHAALPA